MDPEALDYIHDQTIEICMEAIKINPNSIRYIIDQTPELCLMAVRLSGNVLHYIRQENQTEEIILSAIEENAYAFFGVSHGLVTDDIARRAIIRDPYIIASMVHPTEELCILAIDTEVMTLFSINDPYLGMDHVEYMSCGQMIYF